MIVVFKTGRSPQRRTDCGFGGRLAVVKQQLNVLRNIWYIL
jgi:hypothetical protein